MSKAAYPYPPDEFDATPDPDAPRGVHRAPRSAWSRWWPFLVVIVVVPVLAWGAVTLLAQRGDLKDLPGAGGSAPAETTATSTPPSPSTSAAATSQPPASQAATTAAAPPPTAGPNLAAPVSVLNAAKINGLAKRVSDKLATAGFTAVTAGNAPSTAPSTSTVFYGSDDLASTAQLVASTINVANVVQSASEAPSGITVVLRSDPGA